MSDPVYDADGRPEAEVSTMTPRERAIQAVRLLVTDKLANIPAEGGVVDRAARTLTDARRALTTLWRTYEKWRTYEDIYRRWWSDGDQYPRHA